MAKTDRRIVKTKRAIKNALARILVEKELIDITVAELCREADIDRKTFYTHYQGIHSVVEELEEGLFETFEGFIANVNASDMLNNPYLIFERISSAINADMDLYGYLMQLDGKNSIYARLLDIIIEKTAGLLSESGATDGELAAKFFVSGIMSVYRDWLMSDRTQSIEEVSRCLSRLCAFGMYGNNGAKP